MQNPFTKKNTISIDNRKTKKKQIIDYLHGSIIEKSINGWINITISGEPYKRGFQHGYLLKTQFEYIKKVLSFLVKQSFNISLDKYTKTCKKLITPNIILHHPEFLKNYVVYHTVQMYLLIF